MLNRLLSKVTNKLFGYAIDRQSILQSKAHLVFFENYRTIPLQ